MIARAKFRLNRGYAILPLSRLPRSHAADLDSLGKDPDCYGVLWPRNDSLLKIRAISRDMAGLCLSLKKPGRVPRRVCDELGNKLHDTVSALVLDRVLELEQDGVFVAGAAALEPLLGHRRLVAVRTRTARLSIEALKYGQASGISNQEYLSAHLYFYNRLPLSPQWRQTFPTPEKVLEHIGLGPEGENLEMLERDWTRTRLPKGYEGWMLWKAAGSRVQRQPGEWSYKLYVSPLDSVREVIRETLAVAVELGIPAVKTGANLQYAILRPDKIILYVRDRSQLDEAARRLKRRLRGCRAHGVPFTADLSEDGLLSWGADPPQEERKLDTSERESWRLWVTNRLASALIEARTASGVEPWRFAMERLRLEGVDIQSWAPKR